MKTLILSLAVLLLPVPFYAQNPNMVYGSTKSPCTIDLPAVRYLYGGTIINVTYTGSQISYEKQSAFEYACKIVEEAIPTTYPLNISVEFCSLANNCLAMVESKSANPGMCATIDVVDKIYAKRYAQNYNDTYGLFETEGLDFFENSLDAAIKFSSKNNLFSFKTSANGTPSDKYDFVTVAIQALLKAIGFTCKAYQSGNTLKISSPSNIYTQRLLGTDPTKNYELAISNDAYISCGNGNDWLLLCGAPYRQGISLNYFADNLANNETAIMQYGISKGSSIRYIGRSIQDFFSFCGWDRPIITGMGGDVDIQGANTSDVIDFKGVSQTHSKVNSLFINDTEDFYQYIENRKEISDDGNFVLLKDGSWEPYDKLSYLVDVDKYARTVDGKLRLKNVSRYYAPGFSYANTDVTYRLYDYLPQKPQASMSNFSIAPKTELSKQGRRNYSNLSEDTFVDVEIGLKHLEGTTTVVVEQTDSDYPIPYTYVVEDISESKFTALMNQRYPSTFRITYKNKNGSTISDYFTIDLSSSQDNKRGNLQINDNSIIYDLGEFSEKNTYTIRNVMDGRVVSSGDIESNAGKIDISVLKKGTYLIIVYNNGEVIVENKWMKR